MIMLCGVLLCSCKGPTSQALLTKGSSGKTLELLLVADKNEYTGTTYQLVDSLFRRPADYLNRMQPLFDVTNIPHNSYERNEMFRYHRNILILSLDTANKNKVYKHEDMYAAPQVVYEFAARDRMALNDMLSKYYPQVLNDLCQQEYRRMKRTYSKDFNADIVNMLRKNFGIDVTVPDEYRIAPPVKKDFVWMRKETKDFSQHIFVQVDPYTSTVQFSEASLMNHIDSLMKRNVPGPSDTSYVGIERRIGCSFQPLKIDSNYAVRIQGLFRCFGDFYGGPFVSYAVLSPDKKSMVFVTGFLYSPRKDQRDLLMQLDGICRTLNFRQSDSVGNGKG